MSGERKDVQAYVERALASVQAARLLVQQGFYDSGASEAYYAAFHAAMAIAAQRELSLHKHQAVISMVHRDLIRPGFLPVEMGNHLNILWELRNVGDYGGVNHVSEERARKAVELAESFVTAVLKLLAIGMMEKDHDRGYI